MIETWSDYPLYPIREYLLHGEEFLDLGASKAKDLYNAFLELKDERTHLVTKRLGLSESGDLDLEAVEAKAIKLMSDGLQNGLAYTRERDLIIQTPKGGVQVASAGDADLTAQGISLWIDIAVMFGDHVCSSSGGNCSWQLFKSRIRRHGARNHPVVTTGDELTLYQPLREGPRVADSFLTRPNLATRATLAWLAGRPLRGRTR